MACAWKLLTLKKKMWLNQAIQVVTGRPVVGKARHRAGWWNLKQRSNEATAPFFGVIWSPMAQWPNGMSKKWRKLWPRLADLGAYFQTQMTTAVVVEPQNGQSAFLCIFGCKMSRQCLANLPLLSLFFLSFSTFFNLHYLHTPLPQPSCCIAKEPFTFCTLSRASQGSRRWLCASRMTEVMPSYVNSIKSPI